LSRFFIVVRSRATFGSFSRSCGDPTIFLIATNVSLLSPSSSRPRWRSLHIGQRTSPRSARPRRALFPMGTLRYSRGLLSWKIVFIVFIDAPRRLQCGDAEFIPCPAQHLNCVIFCDPGPESLAQVSGTRLVLWISRNRRWTGRVVGSCPSIRTE
jgi:hypothetical protein